MAFDTFERMVAFRYLRARRQEGFISVIAIFSLLGVMLGVATLIIVMSVMNGYRAELLRDVLGLNGHLGVYAARGNAKDFDKLAADIKGVPGVTAVQPLVEGQVLAGVQGRSAGATVRGMRGSDLAAIGLLSSHIEPAAALAEFSDDNVIIGSKLAFKLGIKPGDSVTLLSPQGQATAFGNVPRIKTYRVAATFEVGMYQYDSGIIFMPLPAAQLFFQVPDAVTSLQVTVDDPDRSQEIGYAIIRKLGDSVRVYDWQKSNSAIVTAVEIERNVMFVILSLIILVAAFNIISSMIMLVKDKARDIAILRTMGATRGMILRIFILSGASVGLAGIALGCALGIAFTAYIEEIRQFLQYVLHVKLFPEQVYFFSKIPARIDAGEVGLVLATAFSLAFLATIYPSWRAARLDPVEALRYE
ncbi:MAG TPA: lipoprotein-releasing ABC transporter permease subunit [Stellaceae bacterium]|nr:lipoprotein-releasing ABC transporter permease subunit [Stellaceae bacterium]